MNKENIKIDLVYLWVDGSDENWAEKKARYIAQTQGVKFNKDSINSCRFQDNNELLYSLRSVEKYLPWINHIFIVTDNQKPKWLDLGNNKITLINQEDIMDDFSLPNFNSCAIETYLAKIPGLSEYFLYANDDMFFFNQVGPEFFFDENLNPIYQMGKKILTKPYTHLYGSTIVRANKLVKEKYNHSIGHFPHHGVDPYRKSYIEECIEDFKEEFEITRNNHFRAFSDIQRAIYEYWAIAKKGCKYKIASKEGYCECKKKDLKRLAKSSYPLACINSGRKTTQKDIEIMKEVLQNKFPKISSFENNKSAVNVCYSSDNNYVRHMAASISSILKNKKNNESINVWVIDGGIKEENKQKLKFFENNFDCNIIFVKPDSQKLKNCFVYKGNYLTKAAYYRLLAPDIVASDRVIYLDCDTIVTDSLGELYSMDFNDNYALGVADVTCEKHKARLGIEKYVNSGVLLLNLHQMKLDGTVNTLIKWVNENTARIEYHDQDIINASLSGRIDYIDKKYNAQVRRNNLTEYDRIKNPVIVHFISSKKPWMLWKPMNSSIFGKKYFEALENTPWQKHAIDYKIKSFFIAPFRIFYPTGNFKNFVENIFSVKKDEDPKYRTITFMFCKFKTERKKVIVKK